MPGIRLVVIKAEWLGFLEDMEAAGEICPAGADNLRAEIDGDLRAPFSLAAMTSM